MTIAQTGNNAIDSLMSGESWLQSPETASGTAATTLTFSFMTSNVEGQTGFQAMTAGQQQAALTALATWADVANVKFVEVASGGDIQFGTADLGTDASAVTDTHFSRNTGVYTNTYVYLNNTDNYQSQSSSAFNLVSTPGSYGPSVLIHEIGHALGLKHPGDYDGTPPPYLPASTDNRDYSVMSYNDGTATNDYYRQFSGDTYSVTPMLYDIQAMQFLYGANTAYNAGNTTYAFTNFSAPQAIWDGGGINTFDFSACTGATIINLNAGQFSSTYVGASGGADNVGIAYGVTIQNAVAGSGGSTIYCNSAADVITGGAGNDTVWLSTGTATIDGKGGVNMVELTGASNLAADSFTNIQTLDLNGYSVTLTRAEYGGFTITGAEGAATPLTFADSGRIVANPELSYYHLANGANDFVWTQPPAADNTLDYVVTGASSGTDLYDLRGADLNSVTVIAGQGAQDTLAVSGASGDYTFMALSGGGMQLTDSHVGRDGAIDITGVGTLQFTDMTVSSSDPVLDFVANQNNGRNGSGVPLFHYGIAGTTTDNVIGEQSASLGSGFNAMILTGARSQYDVSVDSGGTLTLTDTAANQTYTITGDHYLIFNNAKIDPSTANYDMDFILQGSDAQVASLYNAALGRLPDLIGLEYYAAPIAQGTLSPHQAAENFLASPEFQSRFTAAAQPADDGGVNDQAFIAQLYQNVLHRTPAASEINYYVADLQGTLPGQDRAQLLLDFATSPENQKDISGWLI